jgi:hopanoid biosynthesis associated protein HpnK
MRRLIVNADDFGWSEAVTSGILRAHRDGVLTSTTVMTNLEGAAGALDRARREAPGLGIGLHLNLTEGEPLAPRDRVAAILDGEGRLRRSVRDLLRTLRGSQAALAAAEAELEAQIVRARDLGLTPTHVDSHKHVHLYPRLLPVVIGLAQRHGIRAVRTTVEVRLPGAARLLPAEWGPKDRLRQRVNAWLLRRWGRAARQAVRRAGLATTDWFFGVRATGGISAGLLERLLTAGPEGTGELMVHPGLSETGLHRPTRLGLARPRELDALCDERVRRAAQAAGWTFITYKDLLS